MKGLRTIRVTAISALVGAVLLAFSANGPVQSAAPAADPDRASVPLTAHEPHDGLRAIFQDMPSYVAADTNALGLPLATIQVTYHGFTPAAQAAFQRAVDLWSTQINSTVPIRVDATSQPLPAGVLGAAGPTLIRRGFAGAPVANTWFPIATADRLAGTDLDPGQPDIEAVFSSTFNFYYGTDGNPGPGQFDFVTVVMHELGHGLGFIGSGEILSSGLGRWGGGSGFPFIFDRYVKLGTGVPFISLPNTSAQLAAALTSGSLFFASPPALTAISAPARLYAPPTYEDGSTFSHLDEATYPAGTANSMMTPQLAQREAIHDPGNITREIFTDIGWGPTSTPSGTPGAPTNVTALVIGPILNVGWTPPSGSPVPTSYRLDFFSGSTLVAQVSVGQQTSVAVGIPPGTVGTFTVRVTAIA